MSIPILDNNNHKIHPQIRVNAAQMADETIESTKKYGLKIGRIKMQMDISSTDPLLPLVLEAFEERGCQLVAVNETPVFMPNGTAALLVSILIRLPAPAALA